MNYINSCDMQPSEGLLLKSTKSEEVIANLENILEHDVMLWDSKSFTPPQTQNK